MGKKILVIGGVAAASPVWDPLGIAALQVAKNIT